jgi:hypothetical protein
MVLSNITPLTLFPPEDLAFANGFGAAGDAYGGCVPN